MSDEFEFYDAPYLLGSLDPDDRVAFEAHLAGCPECSARVDELRPTVSALRAARDAGEVEAPPALLPDLLRRAATERRRRRFVVAGTSLVAAAAVVALALVVWLGGTPSAPAPVAQGTSAAPAPPARPLRALVSGSPIEATAVVSEKKWGTRIDLTCVYAKEFAPTVPYDLVVVDVDGAPHPAGSWRIVPGTETRFVGGTSVPRARIRAIQVTLPDDRAILQLDLQ